MMIENKLTENSSLNDVAKAIQGTYSSNKTETYNETILKNLCFVYAITDTMVSLHSHDDFVFNGEMVSKNVNKVSLKKGDLLIYFIR